MMRRRRKKRWPQGMPTSELLYLIVGYDFGITFRLYEILKILEDRK